MECLVYTTIYIVTFYCCLLGIGLLLHIREEFLDYTGENNKEFLIYFIIKKKKTLLRLVFCYVGKYEQNCFIENQGE